MQTSSLSAIPPSSRYFCCLILSFVIHLALFLGVHQLGLINAFPENPREETISFVELKSTPPLTEQRQENVPEIAPEPEPAGPQKLTSIPPPDIPAENTPGLTDSSGEMAEIHSDSSELLVTQPERPPLPGEAAPENPQALSDAPILSPEPTPVSMAPLPEPSDTGPGDATSPESSSPIIENSPEETEQEEANLDNAHPSSQAAKPVSPPDAAPATAGDDIEAGETEDLSGSPPLSSVKSAEAQKELLPHRKPTKEKVKKVGLLGLLEKPLSPGHAKSKPGRTASREKNVIQSQKSAQFSNEQSPGAHSRKKGEKIARLRSKALQEAQGRLIMRSRSREGSSSSVKVMQESDRNYSIISSSVEIKRSQLKAVYNKQLINNPNLEGNVILEFVVSPGGTVLKCDILTSSLGNPGFEEALIKEILQWRFPKVKKGTTTILFPISFFPSG